MMDNMVNHWQLQKAESKEQIRKKLLSLKEVQRELVKYEIVVPDNFPESVKEYADKTYKPLTRGDVDEVVKVARFWKKTFIPEEQEEVFVKMVVVMLSKLAKLHCCVLSTNSTLNSYIGKFGTINENHPVFHEGYVVSTSITRKEGGRFIDCPGKYRLE